MVPIQEGRQTSSNQVTCPGGFANTQESIQMAHIQAGRHTSMSPVKGYTFRMVGTYLGIQSDGTYPGVQLDGTHPGVQLDGTHPGGSAHIQESSQMAHIHACWHTPRSPVR